MIASVIICALTCLLMIFAVLWVPTVKLGRVTLDSYPLVTLAGAGVLLLSGKADLSQVVSALTENSAVNPLKILILFISMTVLSIFLDELGFFSYLASVTLKRAGTSQRRLFFYLYATVSVLTVFTSNDIIILSFTPFICYFAKNAKISPIPYLAAEFVAANTWSMALIIGNPTNIYLTTAYRIDFFEYLRVMLVPTLCAGATALLILYLLFRRKLGEPISAPTQKTARLENRLLFTLGIVHLAVCTVILAIGSYIGVEMWLVALFSALSLTVASLTVSLVRRRAPLQLGHSFGRAPWQLVPFVLSMFVMVIALSSCGFTARIADLLGEELGVYKYGLSSFLLANVVNNIPMSVLFSSVVENVDATLARADVFATVIGSNLGAFMTPIGALAGIMWSGMLKEQGIKFGYLDFLKIGVTVALPTLAVALVALSFTV